MRRLRRRPAQNRRVVVAPRTQADANVRVTRERFRPNGHAMEDEALARMPGLSIHEVMLLPIERCRAFFGPRVASADG